MPFKLNMARMPDNNKLQNSYYLQIGCIITNVIPILKAVTDKIICLYIYVDIYSPVFTTSKVCAENVKFSF